MEFLLSSTAKAMFAGMGWKLLQYRNLKHIDNLIKTTAHVNLSYQMVDNTFDNRKFLALVSMKDADGQRINLRSQLQGRQPPLTFRVPF